MKVRTLLLVIIALASACANQQARIARHEYYCDDHPEDMHCEDYWR